MLDSIRGVIVDGIDDHDDCHDDLVQADGDDAGAGAGAGVTSLLDDTVVTVAKLALNVEQDAIFRPKHPSNMSQLVLDSAVCSCCCPCKES